MFHQKQVTHVDFSDNSITGVDSRTWSNLIAVRSIQINNNNIQNISEMGLHQLFELKSLHLQKNKISRLESKHIFRHSKFLVDLNIESNPLDFLDAGCTLSSTGKKLDCHNLGLTNRIDYEDVPIVESIDFSGNFINSIDSLKVWGGELSHYVKELKLNNNNIGPSIAGYIEMLNNLETLLLADNKLTTMDSMAFVHNPKLTKITLENNHLDFLQQGCTLNLDASALDCSGLGLTSYVDFQDVPSATIRHMDFSNNNIVTLNTNMWKPIDGSDIARFENLKTTKKYEYRYRPLEKLQLQNNQMIALNHLFDGLTELKTLYTYGNPIALPLPTRNEAVGNCSQLTEVQMGFCYTNGCRYMDLGCQVDLNPPRKLLGTMSTPHSFVGNVNPSNPNFVTYGPVVPKLITSVDKISVTKCGGQTASIELAKCQTPSLMVRSSTDGRITVLMVNGANGFQNGDTIQIDIDQWDCEHSTTDGSVVTTVIEACVADDFTTAVGAAVSYIEITLDDADLEQESVLECSNKFIVGHVYILDVPYHVQRLRMNTNQIASINPKSWEHSMTHYRYKCITNDYKVVGGTRKVHVDEGQDRYVRANEDATQFTSTPTVGSRCQSNYDCEECGVWLMQTEITGELEELWLQNNELADITGYTKMLHKLEIFKLDNNALTFIPPKQLIALQNLIDVSLLGNEGIDFIQQGCLLSGNGQELRCNGLNLKGYIDMPDLPELVHLDFSHNAITSFNPTNWNPSALSLKTLKLNHNQLIDITKYTANLSHLETLYINSNAIDHLTPDQFVQNPYLNYLDVSGNDLDFQIAGCILMTDGTTLDCNHKDLSGFINFTDIPSFTIKRMDFGRNSYCVDQPHYVNQWFCEETTEDIKADAPPRAPNVPQNAVTGKIKYTWRKGITGLGKEMWHPWTAEQRAGTVEELYINSNEIVDISGYTMGLPKLRQFEASTNHLNQIDSLQFSKNSQLERIGLSFNKIQRIHKELFRYNPNLFSINLLANEIDSLAYYQFKYQNELSVLFLGNNQLKTLELAAYEMEQVPLTRMQSEEVMAHQYILTAMYGAGNNKLYEPQRELACPREGGNAVEVECETWWPANMSDYLPQTGQCGSNKICEQNIVFDTNQGLTITRLKKTNFAEQDKCPPDLVPDRQATAARLTYWACK